MKNPFVSVVIPTLERPEVLLNTLEDLLRQNYPNFEIIVVDQSDKINRKVQDFVEQNKKIKFIHLKQKGTPGAKNIGAKKAKGEIILFCDDDVKIENKDLIREHIKNYQDKKVGGVGGRVLMKGDKSTEEIKEVGKFKFFGLKIINNFNADFKTDIEHAFGCNESFSKKAFEKAGGFCTLFGGTAYLEEPDLCLRIKKQGYKMIFEPRAVLHHLQASEGGCRAKNDYQFRFWYLHNYTLLYLEHFNKFFFPLFLLVNFIWALGSGLKRRDFKMTKAMISGLLEGYKTYQRSSK